MKTCGKCGTDKPLAAFTSDATRSDGRHPYCRDCRRDHHTATRDNARDRRYFRRYGISAADVDQLRAEQRYRCAICGRHEDQLPRGLCVDHDHVTGFVRALLCQSCNSGIGLFEEDPDTLRAAIAYLQMGRELTAIAHSENQ